MFCLAFLTSITACRLRFLVPVYIYVDIWQFFKVLATSDEALLEQFSGIWRARVYLGIPWHPFKEFKDNKHKSRTKVNAALSPLVISVAAS